MGAEPSASFILDPREPSGQGPNHSIKPYDEELERLLQIFDDHIETALRAI